MTAAGEFKGALQYLALLLLLVSSNGSWADNLLLEAGYQFERGDFDTDVTTLPVQLTYYGEVWSFAIEVPYISISGVETVIPDSRSGGFNGQGHGFGQGVNQGDSSTETVSDSVTRSGVGDVQLSVARAFFPQRSQYLVIEITATVKLATADDTRFLGTGENDYSLELGLSTRVDSWMPGMSVGYQLTGDRPDTDFNDVVFASASLGYRLDRDSSVGLGIDFQQTIVEGGDDSASLGADYSTYVTEASRLGIAVETGISDSSPDLSMSVFLSTHF